MIYLPSLRYWDPNSRPLDHLSHVITARLYIKRTLYLKKYVRQKWVYCKHLVFLFFSFQCLRSFWSSGVCLGASKTSKNLRLYYCISTLKRASFARSYLQANASGSELKHVFVFVVLQFEMPKCIDLLVKFIQSRDRSFQQKKILTFVFC